MTGLYKPAIKCVDRYEDTIATSDTQLVSACTVVNAIEEIFKCLFRILKVVDCLFTWTRKFYFLIILGLNIIGQGLLAEN